MKRKVKNRIQEIIHKFILWYVEKQCGGGFHTGEYNSPSGRYIHSFTDEEYGYINKLQILDMYNYVDWSYYEKTFKKKGKR